MPDKYVRDRAVGRFPDALWGHFPSSSCRHHVNVAVYYMTMPRCLLLLLVRTVAEQHGDVHELVGLDRVGEGQHDGSSAAQDHLQTSGQASQPTL